MKNNILLVIVLSCFMGFSVMAQNNGVTNPDLNASINQNADLGNYSTFSFTSDIKDKAKDIKSSSDATSNHHNKDSKSAKKSENMSHNSDDKKMKSDNNAANSSNASTAGSGTSMENNSSAMVGGDEWKKVKQGVKYELTSRGYKMVDTNPDLVVSFQILKDDMEIENFENDNAGTAGAVAGNQTAEIQKGSLLISIADRKSGEVIWRGVSTRSITENGTMEDDNNVNMAVASVFDTFGFTADGSTSSAR